MYRQCGSAYPSRTVSQIGETITKENTMEITTFQKPATVNEYAADIKTLSESQIDNAAGRFVFPTEDKAAHKRKIQKAANELGFTATVQVDELELNSKKEPSGNTIFVVTLGPKHAPRTRKGGTVDTGADVVEGDSNGDDVAEDTATE